MKKSISFGFVAVSLTLASILAFVPMNTYAEDEPVDCAMANGETTEGTDCTGPLITENPTVTKTEEHFTVSNKTLDFGRVTETGRTYTKQIDITNNTDNDVIIDASAEKYEQSNQSMTDWVAFLGGVTHFSVAKGSTRSLNVRIVVPSGAEAGSQYATIRLKDASGYSMDILARADIAGDGLKYSSEVASAWIDPVHLDGNLAASVTVKNTGTAGFSSTYRVKSKSMFGGDWQVLQETSGEVLPGGETKFEDKSELGFGIFNIEQRITFVNNEGHMVESLLTRTVINLPWWAAAVAGGVLILIIILIVAIHRKHKKNRSTAEKDEEPEVVDEPETDLSVESEEAPAMEIDDNVASEEAPEEEVPAEEQVEEKPAPVQVRKAVAPKKLASRSLDIKAPAKPAPKPKKAGPKKISIS